MALSEIAEIAAPDKTPPHNFRAEQALLGAIFCNNECYWTVAEFLRREVISR